MGETHNESTEVCDRCMTTKGFKRSDRKNKFQVRIKVDEGTEEVHLRTNSIKPIVQGLSL